MIIDILEHTSILLHWLTKDMELQDAIVRAISEFTDDKGLKISNIKREGINICWNSQLGALGSSIYRVPFSSFEKSIEDGMRYVSILIAFTELITKIENKGMIDNIVEAKRRGSRTYFQLSTEVDNMMNMYVPKLASSYECTVIPIHFDEISDGEYKWDIPNNAEVYACLNDITLDDLEISPEEITRAISGYTGLQDNDSTSVPTLMATKSARGYSYDYQNTETLSQTELLNRQQSYYIP